MSISVIMTVRDGEKYIAQSLDSVLSQVYLPLELIVVDDGSVDQTLNILLSYSSKYSFLKVVKTEGVGRANALNLAVNSAKGEWIANIDSDDLWHPFKLLYQIYYLNIIQGADLISTGSMVIDGNSNPAYKNVHCYNFINLLPRDFFTGNKINHSSVVIRKDSLLKVGLYNCSLKKQIDLDLWHRMLNYDYKLYLIDSALTYKRLHSNQSFERRKRFFYSANSFFVNIRFLSRNEAPLYFYIFNLFRFFYHLLPICLKNRIRRLLS